MKTKTETLKKWIEDANTLRDYADMFPEEVVGTVMRLASVVEKLAYENIALDEERLDFKRRYGNLIKDLYDSGKLEELGIGSYRRPSGQYHAGR